MNDNGLNKQMLWEFGNTDFGLEGEGGSIGASP